MIVTSPSLPPPPQNYITWSSVPGPAHRADEAGMLVQVQSTSGPLLVDRECWLCACGLAALVTYCRDL